MSGLVTTIVPVYNRGKLLVEALDSVLKQTYRPIEIVVVNDGSTDETGQLAEAYRSKYKEVIYVVHQDRKGPGLARETGRSMARGEYIQFLDSDDLLAERKFELQVNGLLRNPHCGISYGKTRAYQIGETIGESAARRTGEYISKMFPAFLTGRIWHTVTPLYRKTVCDEAGPWSNLSQEEDWEYDCRIASMGTNLQYCDEFIADHRNHGGNRLCHAWLKDLEALKDRAYAYALIYKHAKRAGLSCKHQEMKQFSRSLFLVCRQCGAAGLKEESKLLHQLAQEASNKHERRDVSIYGMLARVIGWKSAGKLSDIFDKCRTSSRGISV